MELYIEKKFLDHFNSEFNNNTTKGKKILGNILESYGEIDWFIDCEINNAEQLEMMKLENFFFASRTNYLPPISVVNIEEHFFKKSKCELTLIFTFNEEEWFNKAEKKGALCFSYINFESKIDNILTICESLKIELSERFVGWEFFKELKNIPKNKIIINDPYLLAENSGNKPIDENLIPLIKNISGNGSEIKVELFTNYLNSKTPSEAIDIEYIKRKLHNVFKSDYKLSIEYIQYYEHDRILYSNFFIIECGLGFNFNVNRKSNSKITVESIFDNFYYKRLKNHLKNLNNRKSNSIIN
jgi:hypothetical protein